MRNLLSTLFILSVIVYVNAQNSKKVLFIGNSYTYSNNMPELLAQMANSTGDEIIHESNTPGGYTLKQHSTNTTTLSKINQGNWDFVVLQDQSQYPSLSNEFVEQNVYPYAESLNQTIVAANSCTETLFYATWGRKNGDAQNCTNWPPVCTYEGMDDLLQERYRFMADQNEALLSPVAWVWRYIRENYPNVELYSSDNSHPSLAGSYAAAATFYTIILRKNPLQIPFESNLSPEIAVQLKNAVMEVVYNNMEEWNVGHFDPKSDFTYTTTENLGEIHFQNLSENATEFYWDFGDGNFSTDENPIHVFTENGPYTVNLKASKCGLEDEIEKEIEINLGLNNYDHLLRPMLYSNPVKDLMRIRNLNNGDFWNLYDANGSLMISNEKSDVMNFITYPNGLYIIQFYNSNGEIIEKIQFLKH